MKKSLVEVVRANINVTQEVIDDAVPKSSSHCFVSVALQIAMPVARDIQTQAHQGRFSLPEDGFRYQWALPDSVAAAVREFDAGVKPKPFKFELIAVPIKPIGWAANHPNSNRRGAVYRKTGKTVRKSVRVRIFGANILAKHEELAKLQAGAPIRKEKYKGPQNY